MRIRRGRLHRVHQGVHAVGHRLVSTRGRYFAALLAVGGSVLSHTTGAAAWDWRVDRDTVVHLTVAGDGGRDRRVGVRIHRCTLAPDEITSHVGLAVTTPERTLRRIG